MNDGCLDVLIDRLRGGGVKVASVFTVHADRRNDGGTVEVVYLGEREARAFAESRSQDEHVLAASVTRFDVGQFGARHPVALYVGGDEQPQRFNRPHLYPTADDQEGEGR